MHYNANRRQQHEDASSSGEDYFNEIDNDDDVLSYYGFPLDYPESDFKRVSAPVRKMPYASNAPQQRMDSSKSDYLQRLHDLKQIYTPPPKKRHRPYVPQRHEKSYYTYPKSSSHPLSKYY